MTKILDPNSKAGQLLEKLRAAKAISMQPIVMELPTADSSGINTNPSEPSESSEPIATTIATINPINPKEILTPAQLVAKRIAEIRAAKAVHSVPIVATQSVPIATPIAKAINDPVPETMPEVSSSEGIMTSIDKYGNAITYNQNQQEAVNLVKSGKSCIIVGPAGTGKTTVIRGSAEALIRDVGIPVLPSDTTHKHLSPGTPGIVFVAYTRRAVNNIKRALPSELASNCITIHKLLEYQPVYDQVTDANGNVRNTMQFLPNRDVFNPLPSGIQVLVIEESSMVAVEMYKLITDALMHGIQVIFVGDIQQLPPVFGSAILGYKMLELPTVELTEVYRQALESPIIRLAHRILSGLPIPLAEYPEWCIPGQLTIREWKRSVTSEVALFTIAKLLTTYIDEGIYNPEEDAVLIPYNKACGTIELNKLIGNHLARKSGAVTHEIISGYLKSYYSVGDKVLYDKEDAIIMDIQKNPKYFGPEPKQASTTLDYWGHEPNEQGASLSVLDRALAGSVQSDEELDNYLDALSNADDSITREASHIMTLRLLDSDTIVTISNTGAINSMIFGWALTIHKAQGSEWDKVFLFFHKSHATAIQRELLYTGCTRAKKELFLLCEGDTLTKGILSQRIVGNTLAEKAEFFKGKSLNGSCTYVPSGKEI